MSQVFFLGKIADLCTKLHTTYRSMHILSKLSDLWGKCQLYAISCKSMQKKTILVQKKSNISDICGNSVIFSDLCTQQL